MRSLNWYYDENRVFSIHFKMWTVSLYEKKNAVYYFQISLLVPEILYKQAKSWCHTLNLIVNKYQWWKKISQPSCIENVGFFAIRFY